MHNQTSCDFYVLLLSLSKHSGYFSLIGSTMRILLTLFFVVSIQSMQQVRRHQRAYSLDDKRINDAHKTRAAQLVPLAITQQAQTADYQPLIEQVPETITVRTQGTHARINHARGFWLGLMAGVGTVWLYATQGIPEQKFWPAVVRIPSCPNSFALLPDACMDGIDSVLRNAYLLTSGYTLLAAIGAAGFAYAIIQCCRQNRR